MRVRGSGPSLTPLVIGVLGVLSMSSAFATDTFLPAMPGVVADLRTSPALVQGTITVFMLSQAVGNLVIGPLSDRYGRWRPLLVANAVFVLAGVGAALAQDIWFLLAMRTVQGVGAAANPVISRAVIADLESGPRAARLFGILMVLFSIAPIVAPILGGPLSEWGGWRAPMWAIVVIGVLCLVLLPAVPESLPREMRQARSLRELLRVYAGLLRNDLFRNSAFLVMAGFGVIMSWLTVSSFVLQEHFGFSPTEYAFGFAVVSVGILVFGYVNSVLLRFVRPSGVLTGALVLGAISAAALLVLALAGSLSVVSLLALVTIGFGSTAPIMSNATALAIAAADAQEVGSASALLGTVEWAIPALLVPVLGLFGTSPLPLAVSFVAYFLVAALIWGRLRSSALPSWF